jgi:3-oxoacyl-[acyl-carrier protein] reductase
MDLNLRDNAVLVTGGSRGIGRGIAEAFLDEGAKVVIGGRNADDLDTAGGELTEKFGDGRIVTFRGDLAKPGGIRGVLEFTKSNFGHPSTIVATVGTGKFPPGLDTNEDNWQAAFEANFWSASRLINAAVPTMIERGEGNIILIGSIAGLESIGAPIAYSVAKTAMASLCKNVAREAGSSGIRINMIAPGNIMFPGGIWDRKTQENAAEVTSYIDTEVPMKRLGTVEEIADLAVFLASSRARFVTGACIVADGGQTRGGFW